MRSMNPKKPIGTLIIIPDSTQDNCSIPKNKFTTAEMSSTAVTVSSHSMDKEEAMELDIGQINLHLKMLIQLCFI